MCLVLYLASGHPLRQVRSSDWNCKPKAYQALLRVLSFHIIQNWQIMSHPLDRYYRIFLQLLLVICLAFGGVAMAAPIYSYKVIARYPHSTDRYTEGFFYLNGMFYEGTGKTGRSAVLVIEPKTGKIVQRRDLAPEYFGEGIVDWGPNIYEWTWTSNVCFVYDRASLRPVKQFTYSGEGWGMTRTAKEHITSRWHSYAAISRSQHLQGNSPHRGERGKHPRGSAE